MNIAVLLPEITLFCGGLLILLIDVFFAQKNKNILYINHLVTLIICALAVALTFNNFVINDFLFSSQFFDFLVQFFFVTWRIIIV